jgi:excisionase family DNA binding protein
MTLLTVAEAAAFLKFKNPNSLYNNKSIPRVYAGRLVRFVKEELEAWLRGQTDLMENKLKARRGAPMFRIRVPR